MSGRPEILFPLFADLLVLNGIGPKTAQNFKKMGVTRPRDLLFILPHGLINRQITESVFDIQPPAVITVEVMIGMHKPNAIKGHPYRVTVQDALVGFELVFFHARSDWLRNQLPTGKKRVISGKLELFDGTAQMVHPDYILDPGLAANQIPQNEPLYPLTHGLTQKQIAKASKSALEHACEMTEWIEPSLLKKYR